MDDYVRKEIKRQIKIAGDHPMVDITIGEDSKHMVTATITVGNKPTYKTFTDYFTTGIEPQIEGFSIILN